MRNFLRLVFLIFLTVLLIYYLNGRAVSIVRTGRLSEYPETTVARAFDKALGSRYADYKCIWSESARRDDYTDNTESGCKHYDMVVKTALRFAGKEITITWLVDTAQKSFKLSYISDGQHCYPPESIQVRCFFDQVFAASE